VADEFKIKLAQEVQCISS